MKFSKEQKSVKNDKQTTQDKLNEIEKLKNQYNTFKNQCNQTGDGLYIEYRKKNSFKKYTYTISKCEAVFLLDYVFYGNVQDMKDNLLMKGSQNNTLSIIGKVAPEYMNKTDGVITEYTLYV